MKEIFEDETKLFNNETCPEAIKNSHKLSKGYIGKLVVEKGYLEFVWEDTNEKIIVNVGDNFRIEPERLHHVNLVSEVEFKVQFYKTI